MSFVAAAGAVIGVVGGVSKSIAAGKKKKKALEEQKKAKAAMEQKKKEYEALDTSNLNKNMENKMEDLTINQKGAQLTAQKGEQSRANVMQQLQGAAGGSGVAALAQQMANQGQIAAQEAGDKIGSQEAANQKAAATEASKIQDAKIQGEEKSRTLQYKKTGQLFDLAAGESAAADDAVAAASKEKSDAISGIAGSLLKGASSFSDRRVKKNISKIGVSGSGLNIYSFEYKNPIFGEGLFQGVMSDEVPQETVTSINGYDTVDYSMLDVEFKRL